jgi:ATP-dependent protease ClpP protease subunit
MTTIYLTDVIGPYGIEAKDILPQIDAVTDGVIDLRVNSPGGSFYDGMAIMNALAQSPATVNVTVLGIAASIASVIVIGGGDNVRMSSGAQMMIHEPWSIQAGGAKVFRHEADILDDLKGVIIDVYLTRSDVGAAELSSMLAAETWFGAQEAVDIGFADEVVGEGRAAFKRSMAFDTLLNSFHNVPKALLQRDAEPSLAELETSLRDTGLSRADAMAFVSVGKSALQRDTDERETQEVKDVISFLNEGERNVRTY